MSNPSTPEHVLTPVQVICLMEAYYLAGPTRDLSESYQRAYDWLKAREAVQWNSVGCRWDTTLRGEAWIQMILSTPAPVRSSVYLDPRNQKSYPGEDA